MRFEKLVFNKEVFSTEKKIINILEKNDFHWLIDSEIENASIEIINKTLIWHSGTFYSGNWYYGIWKSGIFHGIWENGIFESGKFHGKFISGIMHDSDKI